MTLMKTIQIESAKKDIMNAITKLKKLYNDCDTSLQEMGKIAAFAYLLNKIDFVKTITD